MFKSEIIISSLLVKILLDKNKKLFYIEIRKRSNIVKVKKVKKEECVVFPFFNKDFFKPMIDGQKELEMKAPNGAIYKFSTNTLDEKTFEEFRRKLEEATKNKDQQKFDEIWNQMTSQNQLKPSIEQEFRKLHEEMQKFFQETSSLFGNRPTLFNNFIEPQLLTESSIDKQIEEYKQKIEELEHKKRNINKEQEKAQLKAEISKYKQLLDEKLVQFGKNLDNEEMKKKLSDEMTEINKKIKDMENKLKNL